MLHQLSRMMMYRSKFCTRRWRIIPSLSDTKSLVSTGPAKRVPTLRKVSKIRCGSSAFFNVLVFVSVYARVFVIVFVFFLVRSSLLNTQSTVRKVSKTRFGSSATFNLLVYVLYLYVCVSLSFLLPFSFH